MKNVKYFRPLITPMNLHHGQLEDQYNVTVLASNCHCACDRGVLCIFFLQFEGDSCPGIIDTPDGLIQAQITPVK